MQPFGNNLVAMDLTGAQLRLLLKQQWCGQTRGRADPPGRRRRPTRGTGSVAASIVNARLRDRGRPGQRADRSPAQPVVDAQTYRVTVNSFLADGGDRFFVLREGTNRVGSLVDTDALRAVPRHGRRWPRRRRRASRVVD